MEPTPASGVSSTAELYERLMGPVVAEIPESGLQVDDVVPDVIAESTEGEIDLAVTIHASWSLVVVLPQSFDPVATTELAALAKAHAELKQRKVKVVAISCDAVSNLAHWKRETEDLLDCRIDFPLVADADAIVARSFGLVRHDATLAVRGLVPATLVVISDPERKARWLSQYASTIGHNFEDVLRVLEALQLSYDHPDLATGANWMAGEDVFIAPSITANDAKAKFPKGFVEIKPWFRLTPPPDDEDHKDSNSTSSSSPPKDSNSTLPSSSATSRPALLDQ